MNRTKVDVFYPNLQLDHHIDKCAMIYSIPLKNGGTITYDEASEHLFVECAGQIITLASGNLDAKAMAYTIERMMDHV